MNNPARLISEIAGEVVRDIPDPYPDYHPDLVRTFSAILGILRVEPSRRAQQNDISTLVAEFSREVSGKLGEL